MTQPATWECWGGRRPGRELRAGAGSWNGERDAVAIIKWGCDSDYGHLLKHIDCFVPTSINFHHHVPYFTYQNSEFLTLELLKEDSMQNQSGEWALTLLCSLTESNQCEGVLLLWQVWETSGVCRFVNLLEPLRIWSGHMKFMILALKGTHLVWGYDKEWVWLMLITLQLVDCSTESNIDSVRVERLVFLEQMWPDHILHVVLTWYLSFPS